jgi:putative transposase
MKMLTHPHTINYIDARRRQRNIKKRGICAQEVHQEVLDVLDTTLTIYRPPEASYDKDSVISVLLYAAATSSAIEPAGRSLQDSTSPNTVRLSLKDSTIEGIESQINKALVSRGVKGLLRHPREVAIDLKYIPYYGEPKEGEEDFIWKSKAYKGTTHFFVYSTCYVIKNAKRFTLALRACRKSEGLLGALKWLLERFFSIGGKLICLYLDRGFYAVKILRFLIEKKDLLFCMAAPQKGKEDGNGIKGLVAQKGVGVHSYTVSSKEDGCITVQVAVVGRYLKGRWGKHKEHFAFVINLFPFKLKALFEKYRGRFGIETTHRIMEKARPRTTSKSATLRLLWVGLGFLLRNLWVWLKWSCVSLPRHGGRVILGRWFSFFRLLSFLRRAIEIRYRLVEEVLIQPP